ncbi:putative calmodulin-binding protein Sha1, partial [Aspergillus aculeatinus CBS 121060]
MSSYIYDAVTPCPSRQETSGLNRSSIRGSFDGLWDTSITSSDSTEKIDFTTDIKPSVLTGVKPRRKTRSNASFLIHDESEVDSVQAAPGLRRAPSTATTIASSHRKSLLAQPAQRFRPKVSYVASPQRNSRPIGVVTSTQHRERGQEENNELLLQINGARQKPQSGDALKKAVRRNTVYIPPDDTTVASVFMGLFSPQKTENVENLLREDTQINSLEAQIARKRLAKRSLNSAAQRAPLNPSTKIAQGANIHVDVPGKNGGKENIPPGSFFIDSKKGHQSLKTRELCERNQAVFSSGNQTLRAKAASKPTNSALASKTNNRILNKNQPEPVKRHPVNSRKQTTCFNHETLSAKSDEAPISARKTMMAKPRAPQVLEAKELAKSSCIIPDNITKPELYEDDWLGHQEVLLTQLMNELLDTSNHNAGCVDASKLRNELLTLYQGASFMQLQKRLKASLLYGALSLPKDVLNDASKLYRDLGLKRKFLDFWIHTYDSQTLRAALEVITGRAIPNSKLAAGIGNIGGEKAMKWKLAGFLDVLLLQNQDMDRHPQDRGGEDGDIAGRAYRRTFLRSIMIIVLLDQAKQCSEVYLPHLLFQPSSLYKSSNAVLQALGQLLLPSCGDIIKALYHLDCQLSYEQRSLVEYQFGINNIAVDLRDGVRLARLVELLIRTLSSRLRFPCMGRAVKLFNVQITLESLSSMDDTRKLVHNLRAEDIVDGHREKTIGLLWGLVNTWGLDRLLDSHGLRREVHRLKATTSRFDIEDPEGLISASLGISGGENDIIRSLLKQWASGLAENNGLHLENFSTCFSDGKMYECIANEYEGHMVADAQSLSSTLESRLQAFGCSAPLGELMATTLIVSATTNQPLVRLICPSASGAHIPDADFTIGVLAFLCSRILFSIKRA